MISQIRVKKVFFFFVMEEQTVYMALSQSRDRGGQETFKKRVALTGAKYVIDKK